MNWMYFDKHIAREKIIMVTKAPNSESMQIFYDLPIEHRKNNTSLDSKYFEIWNIQ